MISTLRGGKKVPVSNLTGGRSTQIWNEIIRRDLQDLEEWQASKELAENRNS